MHTSLKQLIYFFVTLIFWFLLFFVALHFYDPLHVFNLESEWTKNHKASDCESNCEEKTYLFNENRFQNLWMIKHLDFDSIIIWNSTQADASPEHASEVLWWNFINLSIAWSNLYIKKNIIDFVIKEKEIKEVIFTIDHNSKFVSMTDAKIPQSDYMMLYDDIDRNDRTVYLNSKFLLCLIRLSSSHECVWPLRKYPIYSKDHSEKDLSRYWIENRPISRLTKIIKSLENRVDKMEPNYALFEVPWYKKKVNKLTNYYKKTLLQMVIENPDVNFHFVSPANSTLEMSSRAQGDFWWFSQYNDWLLRLSKQSEIYNNMKVYAFSDSDIVDDLDLYRDPIHHHVDINNYIFDSIASWLHELNEDNFPDYLEKVYEKVYSFDTKGVLDQFLIMRNLRQKQVKNNLKK